MSRLPIPGSDKGTWGNVLNDFLAQSHNADGTLKPSAVSASGAATDSTVVHTSGAESIAGTKTFQASPVVPAPTLGGHATTKTYVDGAVAAGAPDATTSVKGIVQLTGDLGGTATSPTVPNAVKKGDLVFNVRDYGATGNASTDDTTAFNNAIAAANTAGSGTVYLPRGTYVISAPLTALASRVYIVGAGAPSVIQLSAGFSGSAVVNITNDYSGIRNVYFVGGPSSTPSSNPSAVMIAITAAKNCTVADIDCRYANGYIIEALGTASRGPNGLTIDNIRATNTAYGIHTKGDTGSSYSIQASITNVNMQIVTAGDVLLIEDSWDVLIMNVNSAVAGTQSSNASDLRISGRCATILCFNLDVGTYPTQPGGTPAVLIESGTNGSPDNINLVGGIFQDSLTGLSITGGSHILVQGVRMQQNGTHGLSITGGSNIQINNCMFSGNGQTAGTGRYDAYINTTNAPITINRCEFLTSQGITSGHVDSAGYNVASAKAVWQFCNFDSSFTAANVFSGTAAVSNFNSLGGAIPSVNFAPTTFNTGVQIPIYTGGATNVGIVVRGAPSQSGDLLRMENSSGTKIANFDSGGNVFGQRIFGDPGASYITGPAGVSASITASYQSGSNIGMLVQRTSSATGDMVDFVDNTNAILAKVDYQGNLTVPAIKVTTSPTNGYILTSDASGNGTWQAAPAGAQATGSSPGTVQLAGDFGGTATLPQVTATHLSAALPINQGGTGSTTQNFVDLSTAQSSISGAKTFLAAMAINAVVSGAGLTVTDATNGGEYRASVDSTHYLSLKKKTSAGAQIQAVEATGTVNLDLDAIPSDGTSVAQVRLFRNVNTTNSGTGYFIYKADGTSSVQSFFSAKSNSYVNALAGNFGVANTSPLSTLDINGSLGVKRTTVADASYSATATDYIIAYTSLTTGRTVTLPTAVGIGNRIYIIIDETGTANTNNITVATTSSQTINGAATKVINTAYGSLKVYSNGANWIITP